MIREDPRWAVCAEAANGRAAVVEARRHKPDIAILDITMPLLNGLEVARRIRRFLPRCEVLVLTMHDSDELIRECIEAGAHAYVLKDEAAASLIAALEALADRRPFFSQRVAARFENRRGVQAAAPPSDQPKLRSLTGREREVLQLVAEGRTTKEIAAGLEITFKTVETHRANIMRKLRLRSVGEVVRFAIRNKVIEP